MSKVQIQMLVWLIYSIIAGAILASRFGWLASVMVTVWGFVSFVIGVEVGKGDQL